MNAFILAAGLGTRLKPLTESKPKALAEINGITLLEILIRRMIDQEISKIVVNVHHFAGQVISFLESRNNFGIEIIISDESDLLLDTGGGLKAVQKYFDDQPFLVHNVDVLTQIDFNDMLSVHKKHDYLATLAVQNRKSSRCFLFNESKKLCGWRNEKTGEQIILANSSEHITRFAFSGVHIIDPKMFLCMPPHQVFGLVEMYLNVAAEKNISYYNHSESLFMDLGKIENLREAEKIIKL